MATRFPRIFKYLLILILEMAVVSAMSLHIKEVTHPATSAPPPPPSTPTRAAPPSPPPPPPPVEMPCAAEEGRCWESGGLWHGRACHKPLEQGPCADGQWLVASAAGQPTGTCVPRPCPLNQFPHQGRCVEEAEMSETCWNGTVFLDAAGAPRCGEHPGWAALLAERAHCAYADDPYGNAAPDGDVGGANVTFSADANDVNSTYYYDASGGNATANVSDDPFAYNATNTTAFSNSTFSEDNLTNAVVYPGARDCALLDDGACAGFVVASAGSVSLQTFNSPLAVFCALVFLKFAL